MKKILIEKGKLSCLIHASDVAALISMKGYLRESVLEEESILKGYCSEDGYYRINDILNVYYIRDLPFIMHRDYLLKLSLEDLETLESQANVSAKKMYTILSKTWEGIKPKEQDEDFLRHISFVDQNVVDELLCSHSLKQKCELSHILLLQSRTYVGNIQEAKALNYPNVEDKKEESNTPIQLLKRKLTRKEAN